MENFKQFSRTVATANWGDAIETAFRRIAVLVAIAYCAGWALGAWVHRANDSLSGAWGRLWGGSGAALAQSSCQTPKPATEAPGAASWAIVCGLRSDLPRIGLLGPQQGRRAPVSAPLGPTGEAVPLLGLTVVQLRRRARSAGFKTAGDRKIAQATKAQLLAIL